MLIINEVIEIAKSRLALWVKVNFKIPGYTVEDFKKCTFSG